MTASRGASHGEHEAWQTYRSALLGAALEFPLPLAYYVAPSAAAEASCVESSPPSLPSPPIDGPQNLEAHNVTACTLSHAAIGCLSRDFRDNSQHVRAYLDALSPEELRELARRIKEDGSHAVSLNDSSITLLPCHVELKAEDSALTWVTLSEGWLSASGAPSWKVTKQWAREGVTCVVSLLRDTEPHFKGARDGCLDAGFRWEHVPLSGKGALTHPDETDLLSWARLNDLLPQLLRAGEHVVVHCAAGMHRTGGTLFLALRRCGLKAEAAVDAVKLIRPVTHAELLKTEKRASDKHLWELAEERYQALLTLA